ncbi:hypothetical protein GHT06_020985 [Daphnia sinensis]|uniref:Uncharacterized protein n=1 Tax=Daphnia sinensis TaxID=1820382 RepID=A0AAD5PQF0_9CRUS|nr:hypothetical protein GHT06_020985 [Daphnia sinensis]
MKKQENFAQNGKWPLLYLVSFFFSFLLHGFPLLVLLMTHCNEKNNAICAVSNKNADCPN